MDLVVEYTLKSYFEHHPLGDAELKSGTGLRIVGCVRSDEGDFKAEAISYIWIILRYKKGHRNRERPRLVAFPERNRIWNGVKTVSGELLVRAELSMADGEPWTIEELSYVVPKYCPRALLLDGLKTVYVNRQARDDMLDAYANRIANASVDSRYEEWLQYARKSLLQQSVPSTGPRFSLVTPAFNTPPAFLREMIESVLGQTYANWELIVVNASPDNEEMCAILASYGDERIRVVAIDDNLGIVGNTNIGIRYCLGDYVCFFDHDDVLEPSALSEFAHAVVDSKGGAGLLFCDEDNIDELGTPRLPLLKPDLNIDLLLSNNYVIHLLTIRRDILASVELSDLMVEGAQDYDLTFKIVETGAKVVHVPHVLYHWRIHSGSSAGDPASKTYAQDAGKTAIERHIVRSGLSATVERGEAFFTYKTRFRISDTPFILGIFSSGKISRATAAALDVCQSRRDFSTEMYVRVACIFDELLASNCDYALLTTEEHDIDVDSLEQLLGYVQRDDVFSVAPRVIRKDGLLDYAGMIIRPDGSFGRLLQHLPQDDGGYVGRAQRPYDSSVINYECCLLDANKLRRLSLDEAYQTTEYSLAAACVEAASVGWCNVFMPYATACLNANRSFFEPDISSERQNDREKFISRYAEFRNGDPSHNPNFDPWNTYYALRR